MNNIIFVGGIALLVIMYIFNFSILDVMAKERPAEPTYNCMATGHEDYVVCCQAFYDSAGNVKLYCTLCSNTSPPSNCSDRFEPPNYDAPLNDDTPVDDINPDIPTTGGVFDEPLNDNVNPAVPPQGGVEDELTESDGQNQNLPTTGITPKGPFNLEDGALDGGQTAPPIKGGLESLLTEQTQQETEQQQQTGNDLNSLLESQEQGEEQQQFATEEEDIADESEPEEQNQTLTQGEPQQCLEGQVIDNFGNCITLLPDVTEQPTEDEGQEGNNTEG